MSTMCFVTLLVFILLNGSWATGGGNIKVGAICGSYVCLLILRLYLKILAAHYVTQKVFFNYQLKFTLKLIFVFQG